MIKAKGDNRLYSFITRIQKLREEKKAISEDERDVFSEAKGTGYDVATMRWALKEMETDAADRAERDALRDTYAHALGLAVSMVSNGEVSLRQAEKITGVSKSSIQRALAVPEVSQIGREMTAEDLGEVRAASLSPLGDEGDSERRGSPAGSGGEPTHSSIPQGDQYVSPTEAFIAKYTDADDPGPIPPFLRREKVVA